MDNLPEDPEFDESRGYLFDESLSTTQERLMREMNEYLASISQLPIEADGSGEPSTIDDDSCSLSSGGSLLERGRKYFAKEDKSDGEKAHPGSNNRAMVSIDEHVGHDDIAKEYEYYNDFDDDSVVAMAKRMDDVSILSDPSLICGPSEKILSLLPSPPLPKKISAGKSDYRGKFKMGKSNLSNRTKVVPPPPPRNANDSQRPPHGAPPRQQPKQMNSISTEFKSKTNHEQSIPPRNPSCSPTHSKECIGVKQELHRRASSDSANFNRLRLGGEMDSEQARGEWVAAIGLHVATPKGKRSPKLAPASCEEGMKAHRGSDGKLGETRGGDAGHKVTAKSGLKGTSPQVKRRLGKRDSKPESDGDDELMHGVGSNTRIHACKTKVDNEPKKVRGQPQSQSTKNPQMPPKGIEGRVRTYNNDGVRENDDDGENDSDESTYDDASIHVKAHAHKPSGNSQRPPLRNHSQRRHDQFDSSEDDDGSANDSAQTLKARGGTGSKLREPDRGDDDAGPTKPNVSSVSATSAGEQSAGYNFIAKSGLKGTSRQVKRRLGKRDSKPESDGDDELMNGVGSNTRIHACKTKVDNEPKKVRGQPQSQSTKNPQMPPKGIEGRVRTYNNDGVRENDDDGENDSDESTEEDHTHKPSGNSQRPPRVKHSQRRHDQYAISECDEDSDTTQFFYESTDDDEEELGAAGTSVADAVKDLNEKRVVTKVKNLFGIIF